MSDIQVVEVESAAQLKQFINYPRKLYAGHPQYVMPLYAERREFFDKRANPFYRTAKTNLFLALRGGEVVGRIATCVSYRHNDFHNEATGFFGFFDTPDDFEIARSLLKVAMITLKKEGMDRMRGPMNFTTNHEIGFLVEGFDHPPMVMMTYNFPYQPKLAEQFGLKKCMDLLGYKLTKEQVPSERVRRVLEARAEKSRVRIRTVDMSRFDREVEMINEVYNAAWARNWGFVPLDRAEFDYIAKGLKQVIDPHIVCIAEHEGRPIGFCLALPDINVVLKRLNGRLFPFGILKLLWLTKIRRSIDSARLVIFGVIPEFQKQAVELMLYSETFRRGVERGYQWAELSWTLETNHLMRRASEQMQAVPYKRYRIMEMPL